MTVDEELPRCLNNSVIIVLDGPFRDIAGFAECHTLHNIILSPFIGGFPLLFDFFLFDERGSVAIFINFNIPPLSLNNHVALFVSFRHCSSFSSRRFLSPVHPVPQYRPKNLVAHHLPFEFL